MDCLTFISSIIESLAWPVASVIILIAFKDEVVKAVPFVKRLKAGPVEAEFDREVKQLKETTAVGQALHANGAVSNASKALLFQLAELHPRSAILEAWVRLEAAARAALPHDTSKAAEGGYVPAARLPEELIRAKKIDQSQVTLYHELRRLRNDAAHLVGPEPTQESVRSYIELASSLQVRLEDDCV